MTQQNPKPTKDEKQKRDVLEAVFTVTVQVEPGDFAALHRAQEELETIAVGVKVKSTRTVKR